MARSWLKKGFSLVLVLMLLTAYAPIKAYAWTSWVSSFKCTSVDDRSVQLNWSLTNSSTIQSEYIEQSSDNGATWTKIQTFKDNTGGAAVINNLQPGATYQFRMTVVGFPPYGTETSSPITVNMNYYVEEYNPLPDQTLVFGYNAVDTIDLSNYFRDEGGGPVSYTMNPIYAPNATATIRGSILTITAVTEGDFGILLWAANAKNFGVQHMINVHVRSGIIGHVSNKDTGEPVAGAEVRATNIANSNTIESVLTNANGDYVYPLSSGSTYKLHVTAFDYLPFDSTGTYTLAKNSSVYGDMLMSSVYSQANIESFSLPSTLVPAVIDPVNATVDITVDSAADVMQMTPTIYLSKGATSSPASGVPQDFTNPVTYTITSKYGTPKTWTVRIHQKPLPPTVNPIGDSDTVITGNALTGTTVQAYTGSTLIGTVLPSESHTPYRMNISKIKVGTTVTVKAVDSHGNASDGTVVTVRDNTPPTPPTVNRYTNVSSTITGKSEPLAVIKVKSATTNQLIKSGTAGADGTFSITMPTQPLGSTLLVTATDAVGLEGQPTTVTVVDGIPPDAPEPTAVTNTDPLVSGFSEPNSVVSVYNANTSALLGSGTAAQDGFYSFTIPLQSSGTSLLYTATDAAGNVSTAVTYSVLNYLPPEPYLWNPMLTTQDTVLSGRAENANRLTVRTAI
ncbi:MAG: Ig-like domain-containing protein, partial [Tumebacillaceae bacterium]